MPSEVKMPQLGMNQDSAVIVTWLKASGDKIKSGEPIFEVETDKATVEVEATADGYLTDICAGEGADVPVGNVIATIVETKAEVFDSADEPAALPESASGPEVDIASETNPKQAPAAAKPATKSKASISPRDPAIANQQVSRPSTAEKVLASPKAKRLASERGINLGALRAQGVTEPIHTADLARAGTGGQSSLTAHIEGYALNVLLDRSEDGNRTALFAAFAAGGWRAIYNCDHVTVALREVDGTSTLLTNPDRGGNGKPATTALTLVDLCDTRLSGFVSASGGVTLCTARNGENYVLTLSFSESSLPMVHAVALLDTIAARIRDPIRQLL